MKELELQGSLRTETGKGKATRLRKNGLIPGIVYGNKGNLMVTINHDDMVRLLQKATANAIFNLKVEKKEDRKVVIKEVQRDVITRNFLHVDLFEISMKKKIKISVPIEETGQPVGIKMGGILTHILRELKVECLPESIPETIKIDVSNLDVGHNLHVRDIEVPDGVTVLSNPDETICSVNLAEAEKSKEPEEEEAAAAAEEEAVAGEAPAGGPADAKEKTADDKGQDKEKDQKK
jgi:large subunit ribosomal protein L25